MVNPEPVEEKSVREKAIELFSEIRKFARYEKYLAKSVEDDNPYAKEIEHALQEALSFLWDKYGPLFLSQWLRCLQSDPESEIRFFKFCSCIPDVQIALVDLFSASQFPQGFGDHAIGILVKTDNRELFNALLPMTGPSNTKGNYGELSGVKLNNPRFVAKLMSQLAECPWPSKEWKMDRVNDVLLDICNHEDNLDKLHWLMNARRQYGKDPIPEFIALISEHKDWFDDELFERFTKIMEYCEEAVREYKQIEQKRREREKSISWSTKLFDKLDRLHTRLLRR